MRPILLDDNWLNIRDGKFDDEKDNARAQQQ